MSGFLFVLALRPAAAHPMAYTVVHRTPLDAAGDSLEGLKRLPFAEGLLRTSAAKASLTTAVLEAPFPFDDLVASWNAMVPRGASLEMQAQVRGEAWSPWFGLGRSEGDKFFSGARQDNEFGHVEIDTLKLKRKATALRLRLLFRAPGRPIRLRLYAATVSNEPSRPPDPFQEGPWVRELAVAPRSQMEEQERYRHDICSPTALAMALEFWGLRVRTIEAAERVKDQVTGIFGHWPFNVAAAGALGLEGFVARLEGLSELQSEISQGRPVVASLTFGPGELPGAPLKKTKGHLLLVTGFTREGDVIALDPAAPDRGSARRVYPRLEFDRAWRVNKRGLCYLLGPLEGRRLAVGVPVADLWASPGRRKRTSLHDPEHLSQLLYGEIVTLKNARGNWVRVAAEEQPDFFEGRRWQGYPGWVRAEHLSFALPPPPNAVVRTRQALLQRGAGILVLSVGTRLSRVSEGQGVSFARLLDGGLAELPSDTLYAPPEEPTPESRSQIVRTAELFLGTSYYWGGRSGVQPDPSIGVDCSGLVSLAYRIHGLDIPRDSHEQKLKSRPVGQREMKPGDLIFLSDSERSLRITHVMIYTGGDGFIESRESSGRVLRSTFRERFGKPFAEAESGETLLDYSLPKPRRRRIYFGSYF